jgi:hypothetical protein
MIYPLMVPACCVPTLGERGRLIQALLRSQRHSWHDCCVEGRWEDFTQTTRSKTAVASVAIAAEIVDIMELLLSPIFPAAKGIRLLGITLSSLDDDYQGEP